MTPPPTATPDRLVRLFPRELAEIVFQHLHTLQDEGVLLDAGPGARRAGITEWQGLHRDRLVSLGWDWCEVHDGLRRLPVVPPRTNLRLVDAQGYDLPLTEEALLLARHIDGLAWQDAARLGLAEPDGGPYFSMELGRRLH
jgi:hypothetical protein